MQTMPNAEHSQMSVTLHVLALNDFSNRVTPDHVQHQSRRAL